MKSPPRERSDGGPDLYACADCSWTGPYADLQDIESIWERVDAGGPVPNGECPECRALAYQQGSPLLVQDANAWKDTLSKWSADADRGSPDGYNACPICGSHISGSMDTPIAFVQIDSDGNPVEWNEDIDVEFVWHCNGDPEHTALEMHEHYETNARLHEPPAQAAFRRELGDATMHPELKALLEKDNTK